MIELLLAISKASLLISGPLLCYGRPVGCELAALAFPAAGGAKVALSEPSAALPSLAGLRPSLAPWLLVLGVELVGSFLPSIDPFLLLFTSGLVGPVFPSAELSLLLLKGATLSVASRLFRPCELFVGSSDPVLLVVTASVFLPVELLVGSSSFLLVASTASVFEGLLEEEALSFLA